MVIMLIMMVIKRLGMVALHISTEDRWGWQHESNINDETGFLDLELTFSSSSVFREGVEVTVGEKSVEVAF